MSKDLLQRIRLTYTAPVPGTREALSKWKLPLLLLLLLLSLLFFPPALYVADTPGLEFQICCFIAV